MERLESAEQAVIACEEVITHERQNRKTISKELKARNAELRELVNKEKRKLQDKVHDELEKTLQQALKEKMNAERKLLKAKTLLRERDMMAEEMDSMYLVLRANFVNTEKLCKDQ